MLSADSIITILMALITMAVIMIFTLRFEIAANSQRIDELRTELRENRKDFEAKLDKIYDIHLRNSKDSRGLV